MQDHNTNIVVIGGVAGGMSFAARARRLNEHASITVFEKGEHVSFANCGLPYYLGGEITKREALLLQTPQSLRESLNLDVRVGHEVIAINREHRTVRVRRTESGEEFDHPYDTLALSPGARPIVPPIPGVELPGVFTLRNVSDIDAIVSAAQDRAPHGTRAIVVGGGFIGLEVAEAFRHRGNDVVVIELAPQVLAPLDPEIAAFVETELRRNEVDVRTGVSLLGLSANDETTLTAQLSDESTVNGAIVVLAVGVQPDTALAQNAGIACTNRGAIIVNEQQQTSDPNILAFGDATQVTDAVFGGPTVVPLAGPASRHARTGANALLCSTNKAAPVLGTAIVRVFDVVAAATGRNEKSLQRDGLEYHTVYTHPANHAGYFPGATQMHLKVIFAPDGRVLGAQAVGSDGVDKRIDVLATAIRAQMTMDDLAELELCYAPPFGSAKDPVNMAGFVGQNVLSGVLNLWNLPPSGDTELPENAFVLDVRSPAEYERYHLPNATLIPHTELRDRMSEVPNDRPIRVYCASGFRSYLAARILMQHGWNDVASLNGGLLSFRHQEL